MLNHPTSAKPSEGRTNWVEEVLFMDGYNRGIHDFLIRLNEYINNPPEDMAPPAEPTE